MLNFERSRLSDQALLRDLASHLARERSDSAVTLADLAEVDERKLYLPAGFPSMYAFCVGELHLCEQAAYKRIAAARAARRFPAIFAALPASPPRSPASPPAPDTAREAQGPCSGEVACQLSP